MSSLYDIIREKGNRHEDPVPDDAWDNIMRKKNKRRFVVFIPVLAVLLVGLMIAAYFIVNNSASEIKPTVVEIPKGDRKNIESDESFSQKIDSEKLNDQNNSIIDNAAANEIRNDNTGNISENVISDRINQATTGTNSTDAQLPGKSKSFTTDASRNSVAGHIPDNNNTHKISPATDQSVKRTVVIKDKSRSNIKISDPGTEEADEKARQLNEDIALTTITTTPLTEAVDNKETLATVDTATAPAVQPKLIELYDPIKTNTVLISETNKTKKAAAKKSTTKHPWFFEAALIPVVPFQQYDEDVTFSRSLILKDGNATFSGKLVQADLDPTVAFQVGLRTELNKKWSLKTGIQYLQLRESVSISGLQTSTLYSIAQGHVNIDDSPGFVTDTSSVVLESTRNFKAVNSYSFVSIPVSFQYKFLQNKTWSLGIESGLAFNIFNKYSNYIDPNSKAPLVNNSQNRDDKTTLGMSANAGLRVGKFVNKRAELFVLPSFSYGLFEQHVKHNIVNKRISLAGIGFGISYKIR